MKILVMGCGAMGSIYAGLLAGGGNDVVAVDTWTEHVAAMQERGLRVEGASGDRVVRVRALEQVPAEPMDLIVVAVKAAHVAEAAGRLTPAVGPATRVLTIQNGMGSADLVARAVGAERVAVGIAGGFGAQMRGPAHTFHNGMEIIRMGAYSTLAREQVDAIAALWRAAGFKAEAVDNIAVMQWEKLICNVAYSAPCALTGMTVGEVMDDVDMGPVSRAAAIEAWEVARARGVALAVQDPVAHVRAFGAKIPNAKPSLLQDLENGRPSEIDVINGAVPREAALAGMQAPVNATLTALVRQRERRAAR